MAALIYFNWSDRDRQNLSLGIISIPVSFSDHVLAKNPLSGSALLTGFFPLTSSDVLISLLSL